MMLLILGCLIGLFLDYKRGLIILTFGIIGAICVCFYTGKPLKLKYRGLGAPIVFMIFRPLITLGSYYLQMQEFTLKALCS